MIPLEKKNDYGIMMLYDPGKPQRENHFDDPSGSRRLITRRDASFSVQTLNYFAE